jgi:hypothetical protein
MHNLELFPEMCCSMTAIIEFNWQLKSTTEGSTGLSPFMCTSSSHAVWQVTFKIIHPAHSMHNLELFPEMCCSMTAIIEFNWQCPHQSHVQLKSTTEGSTGLSPFMCTSSSHAVWQVTFIEATTSASSFSDWNFVCVYFHERLIFFNLCGE